MPSERAVSVRSCEPCASARSKRRGFAQRRSAGTREISARALPSAEAPPWPADRRRLDPVQLEQLHRLRVLARGHLDLVPALAQQPDQRPEDEHVRRVREVDPDAHLRATLTAHWISFAYGHAPAGSVLRGGRAAELLRGGGAARGDAAGRQPAGARARAAARDAAPRPLRPAGRADRGRAAALPRRAADARVRGAAARGARRAGGAAPRDARDRRVDRAGGDRAAAAALRVPARQPGAARRAVRSRTRSRSSSSSPTGGSSSGSSAPPGGTARSRSSRSSATR